MDTGVKCIKMDFTIDQYLRGTARSLGELPDGMGIDSCYYTTSSNQHTSLLIGIVKMKNGKMMFTGNHGNKVTPDSRVTVFVSFRHMEGS